MSGSFGTEILNLLLGLHISTYRRNFSQILQVLVIQGSEAPASTFCLPLILFSNDFGAINLHNSWSLLYSQERPVDKQEDRQCSQFLLLYS